MTNTNLIKNFAEMEEETSSFVVTIDETEAIF